MGYEEGDYEEEFDFTKEKDLEMSVGIRVYATSTLGVTGQIKTYASDFIVCEITPLGEILSIDSQDSDDIYNEENLPKRVKFTGFTLVKQMEDTILVGQRIAKSLNISPRSVSWAGLKDNKAITSQRMCIKGNYIKELAELRFNNFVIKDIRPLRKPIQIGNLWGNHFEIIMREPEISQFIASKYDYKNDRETIIKNTVQQTTEQIQKNGFPNFYGMQRFGSYRPNSYSIGKLIFLKKYKEAVDDFLCKTFPKEIEMVKIARKNLSDTQDFEMALRQYPSSLYYERIIIGYLLDNPGKYMNALLKLPTPLLNLLLSSYQSYLFNCAVSTRKENGDNFNDPQKGDNICLLHEKNGPMSPIYYEFGKDHDYDKALIKALKLKRATITCPVIGYDSDLSKGYFGKIYRDLLDKEEFSKDYFKNLDFQAYDFKGTYRPIYVKPKNLSAKYIKGKNIKGDFIKLEFSLPKGTYATMLIREFTKSKD